MSDQHKVILFRVWKRGSQDCAASQPTLQDQVGEALSYLAVVFMIGFWQGIGLPDIAEKTAFRSELPLKPGWQISHGNGLDQRHGVRLLHPIASSSAINSAANSAAHPP